MPGQVISINQARGKSKTLYLTSYGYAYRNRGSKGRQMSDEEALRRLARAAISAERIPAERPNAIWGGNGSGALCDICDLSIADDEIGFEVEFSRETASARTYHFHSRCLAAWELERHAVEL